jgi:hypothetical protein
MKLKYSVLLVAACVLFVFAYRVQKGDTLWDLSEEYLKDPFAWPDMWKANPHIEDPHWIYPGDSICIPGEAACPETGGSMRAGQGDQDYANTIGSVTGNAERFESGKASMEYRKPDQPKIFNTYYQRLMPILEPVGQGETKGWFIVLNDEIKKPIHHSLEHDVLLGFGKRAFPNLKEGDIAEIWSSERVSIPNSSGSFDEYYLRRLSALAKVTGVGDSLSRATILQSFGMLHVEKSRSRPQQPVKTIDVKSFTSIKQAKASEMAEVLFVLDKSIIAGLYSYILINGGQRHNYVPGSAVAFWDMDKRDPTLPPRLLGRGLVVYSDDARSTVLIRDLYNASRRVDIGTPVSLTHQPVK